MAAPMHRQSASIHVVVTSAQRPRGQSFYLRTLYGCAALPAHVWPATVEDASGLGSLAVALARPHSSTVTTHDDTRHGHVSICIRLRSYSGP